ncbi:PHP domain-containing protein [Clostridium lundense]|uniref:PHP domain-containing protein n=1 Tax=Clostridium lundense TaxID=319475 RepID=UPI0004881C5E|nr:PHP domain-containing protein [Clostridium lundense]
MKKHIDLHMHSIYSDDGEFTPSQLVYQCKQAGIRIMSISDHNCVKSNKEAEVEAHKAGIQYIPAIEIDCTYKDVNLHVLGYGINYESQEFAMIEENVVTQELKASQERLKLTHQLGFQITQDELKAVSNKGYGKNIWTGEMIAEVLLQKEKYLNNELLKPYRSGGLRSDNPYVNFYWDYYSQGKLCYAEIKFPTLEEIIGIIHKNGGKAVLAHPGNNLKGKFELFDDIVLCGIDGVEAFSSYHNITNAYNFYVRSQKYSLLVTCGSDYHGKTKPSIQLGESGCFIDEKEIETQLLNFELL